MPRRALEIVAEICSAIEFSHRHGIIHRDIKPGNVMLTQTGQIKVMDFGIARALSSGASTMTQTSAVIGTAQYLSPEQARGETVDARSDVYATGCVLFELLCGHPPFVGDSPVSVAYQHVREEPKAPSLSNRDVTPAIDSIVLKALAKNPLNRYQSAGEMRADLLRAAAGRPVYAEPVMPKQDSTSTGGGGRIPGSGQRPGQPARVPQRRRTSGWVIAALTALAVLAVVALVAGLIVSQQPSQQTVPTLVGKTRTDAEKLLHDRKLVPKGTGVNDSSCTPNVVTSQDVTSGSKVDEGTTVQYSFCLGPGQAAVPQVLNLGQQAATDAVTKANLTPAVEMVDSDKPQGTVVTVDPPVGTQVQAGSKVTLQISRGNLKPLPNVSGLGYSADTATAVLTDRGFPKAKITTVDRPTTNPAEDGKVLAQDPPAGNVVDPTLTAIHLFVGNYTPPPSSPPASPTA
jgi:serine/threonine-protein kinase